jgi:3-oxoadipate enol-lactonase
VDSGSCRWLLLHGTPLRPRVWDGVVAILGADGQVRCPDSAPHADDAGGSRSVQARIAERIVDEELGVGLPDDAPVRVVGHSFGGQVAIEVALAALDRITSLTLVCSRDTPFPAFVATARALRDGVAVDLEASMRRWFRPDELAAGGTVVQETRESLAAADRTAWATALTAIAGYDRAGEVGRIGVPVTLIAAGHEVSTPAAMAALAGRLPDATLTVLPDAAHMSPFLDPVGLAHLVAGGATR